MPLNSTEAKDQKFKDFKNFLIMEKSLQYIEEV